MDKKKKAGQKPSSQTFNMQDKFQKIKEEAKKFFEGKNSSHGWDHTERVLYLALHIGKKENANLEVIELSSLLHDIAREEQNKSDGKICHAEKGAVLAKEILEKYGFEKETIDNVIHCIKRHRFKRGEAPETLEAKVLYDADKLDAIGAVGLGRAFQFAGEIGAKLHNSNVDIENTKEYSKDDTAFREFSVKLRKVKDSMFTREGKRIAEERHNFMINFFDRLEQEIKGEV